MGLLDIFRKANEDLVRTQRDLKVSQDNLSRAEKNLSEAQKVDKKLKDRFVGKLFRGKLIEDIHVATRADGNELIRISGRVISFEEYLTNDYEELIKDDAWISGAFGIYGGVADREWWNVFIGTFSGYYGVDKNDGNVSANKSLSTTRTGKIIKSYDFTQDEDRALNKILTDELGMDEMFFFPYKIKGYPSTDILEEAYYKVIDFLIEEVEPLKANGKRWYRSIEGDVQEELVDKAVSFADTVVDEIVRVKELEK